jgi:nucleoside-diphosphate-sugar epimerase
MPDATTGPVCVTGANGFIGSHVTRELLERGDTVRATVRDPSSPAKTAHLEALAEGLDGTLEFASGDLLADGSFDEAIAGCVGVFHTAAVVSLSSGDPQRTIVDPSLRGAHNVYGSIGRAGTVTRVVHTSSIAAIVSTDRPASYVHGEGDWSDSATLAVEPYSVAKREAERLAWRFTEDSGGGWSLVSINPGFVFGECYAKPHAKGSCGLLRDLVSGKLPAVPALWTSVVDAGDVATAHVEAYERDEAAGRYILSAAGLWYYDLAARLQTVFPDYPVTTRRLPKLVACAAALVDKSLSARLLWRMLGARLPLAADRAPRELGFHYRPLDETLRDCLDSMVSQGFARLGR